MSHSVWKPLHIQKKEPCVKNILAKHVISLKHTTKHNCPQGKYPLFYYFRSLFSTIIMSLGLQFLVPIEGTI